MMEYLNYFEMDFPFSSFENENDGAALVTGYQAALQVDVQKAGWLNLVLATACFTHAMFFSQLIFKTRHEAMLFICFVTVFGINIFLKFFLLQ